MNPFRQPSETAVNKTEIECTKIREREATKRARLEQREKTKRERGDGWVAPWIIGLLVTVVVCITGGVSYSHWLHVTHPNAESPDCVEKAWTMRNGGVYAVSCEDGGWLETIPSKDVPGEVLARCNCGSRPGVVPVPSVAPNVVRDPMKDPYPLEKTP